jgi:hypothetical protein
MYWYIINERPLAATLQDTTLVLAHKQNTSAELLYRKHASRDVHFIAITSPAQVHVVAGSYDNEPKPLY